MTGWEAGGHVCARRTEPAEWLCRQVEPHGMAGLTVVSLLSEVTSSRVAPVLPSPPIGSPGLAGVTDHSAIVGTRGGRASGLGGTDRGP